MPAQISPLMRGALEDATRRLSGTIRGVFSDQTVALVVKDSYERLGDRATVGPNFMPIFVERFAAGQPLEAVRRIRCDVHHHVTGLLDTLNIAVVEPR